MTWHLSYCLQTVFVAATKVDLPGRKVTEAEGQSWAAAHSFPYFEVSCCHNKQSSDDRLPGTA